MLKRNHRLIGVLLLCAALACLPLTGCGSAVRSSSSVPPVVASEGSLQKDDLSDPPKASGSSAASEPEPAEGIDARSLKELEARPEYQAVLNSGANIASGIHIKEAVVDQNQLGAFLDAYQSKGDASFAIYDFAIWDCSYYEFTMKGGLVTSSGWIKLYGRDAVSAEWNTPGYDVVEVLCTGELIVAHSKGEGRAVQLGIGGSKTNDPNRIAYQTYLKALEFNLLGEQWDMETPFAVLDSLVYYFEQSYGADRIWLEYPSGDFPAEVFEQTIQKHFAVSSDELRAAYASSGMYSAQNNVYHYEGGRGGAYFVLTRIHSVEEIDDGMRITYSFDEFDIDKGYAFETGPDGRPRIKQGAQRWVLTIDNAQSTDFKYLSNQRA